MDPYAAVWVFWPVPDDLSPHGLGTHQQAVVKRNACDLPDDLEEMCSVPREMATFQVDVAGRPSDLVCSQECAAFEDEMVDKS
jgi:hypothetical protein